MDKITFLRVKLIVKQGAMTPNDAVGKYWLLPLDAIAKLERYTTDLYTVTLKKEYESMVHERIERLEAKLPDNTIQIFG